MEHQPLEITSHIGGVAVRPSSDSFIPRYDPGNVSSLIGLVGDGVQEVGAAVDSARESFDGDRGGWVYDYRLRAKVLSRAAEILRERSEELARLESLFSGKTVRTSRLGDIPRAAEILEFYAGIADKVLGHSQVLRNGDVVVMLRQPVGVVAAITPWNFPLLILVRQTAPALAVGCTVVAKPASHTPATAVEFAKILEKAGAPPGVFNVVTGPGAKIGEELLKSGKVDVVNFTGETETGKRVMVGAATTLKRVVLELGGKNPNIVFEDADLEQAANAVTYGAYANNGESCAAGSRLLVHKSVKERFVQMVAERVRRLRVGYQLDENSDVGPLVSQQQMEKVLEYVAAAMSEGLKIVVGGGRAEDEGLGKGYYVSPTLVDETPPSSKLFREEVFGPVLTVTGFESEEEAVWLANSTQYGLAAGVWSNDSRRAVRVAEKIKAGTVWVNTYYTLPVEQPWGGFKQSGIGRNNTVLGVEHYLEWKGVYLDSQKGSTRPYYRLVLGS